MNFKSFLLSNQVSTFFNKYKNIIGNNNTLAVLISKNYKNKSTISTKIYCELRDNNVDIYKNFFTDTLLIEQLLPFWNKDRESSLCVGLKYIESEKIYVPYFHIKFNYNKIINLNIYKPEKSILPENNLRGISIEFYKTPVIKKYFYYNSILEKEFFSKKFKLHQLPSHFEYTEYNNLNKMIFVYENNTNIKTTTNILKLKNKKINSDIKSTYKLYKVLPCFYGKYISDDVTSVYWSLTKKKLLF